MNNKCPDSLLNIRPLSSLQPLALPSTLMLASLLSACGGDGDNPPASSASSNSSVAASSSAMAMVSSSSTAISSSSMAAQSSSSAANSSVAANACIEDPLASGYCLVWADEFSGNSVDQTKWSYERNCYGGGNAEAQCYVDDAKNVWVDGDILHLKAIREDAVGPAIHDDADNYDPNDTSGTGTYTSGRLRSAGKGDWKYGRFDIRAKLPYGQGTWPAIWMLPTDWVFGGWASSGEIDIMEAVNLKVDGESAVHGTLHYGDNWPNNVYSGVEYPMPGNDGADDFHVYSVEWEEGEVRWYVDGDHYATQVAAGWYSAAALDEPNAPFNQRFHMLLNLAVGGNWAAQTHQKGIDESVFPQEMQVDYVRVYQCSKDFETGKGCATRDNDFTLEAGNPPPEAVDVSGDTISLFNGATTEPYTWGVYAGAGSVDYQVVDAGGDYGLVGEITFNTDNGIGFYQSPSFANLSDFDYVEFDLRITADPRATKANLTFRADCGWPCTSGSFDLGYPTLNTWTHYRISLSELATQGLDTSKVNTPFVISPVDGNQMGVVMQVDNVKITKAAP